MAGIIVELIISWLLLWFFEKKHLNALGFTPTRQRLAQFLIGFVIAATISSLYHLLTTAFIRNSWKVNPSFTFHRFWSGVWWVLKSVLFEELIFRGALLYIAIKRIGMAKACLLSALCFGVYHWFSYGAFGNPLQMTIILVMTGIAGWAFAYAFAKTGSLYLPIALHFAWNIVNILIFSSGPLGKQFLIKENSSSLQGGLSLLVFLFQLLVLPAVTYAYLRFSNIKKTST